ncbi:DUF6916 family protein [Clostridium ljungdahlii]|uniref:DUF6916 domain-containing protein n=1 Tax=Clostridium ljungdahlii (strain ATCC 55383 / DSM 13528 / PETC) TaxID=748727 RepID=D8GPZ0_CLOLD|nr:hypothetical protein [Clostridium ljungdahlii]ADK16081.1 hypothetical protein CLJU_c30330 [Clostridium ljungdahlii DSM 13528]OAA87043.1 hypothetical protein WX45_03673 [Clostridium ljungdahlii DSM 13528]
MLGAFTNKTFSVGDIFKVSDDEENFFEIVLVKVSEGKYKMSNAKRDPFTLIFKRKKDIFINQGTYKIEQEKVGIFHIFMTPMLPLDGDQEAYYYQACFS